MPPLLSRAAFAAAVLVSTPLRASGQPVDAVGTRAAGMSGAFVAVVDDASAVYWNPGALATGSYLSLVIDRTEGRTGLGEPSAGSRSGFLIGLAAPALGLSYYRLRSTTLGPPDLSAAGSQLGGTVIESGQVRVGSLVTHHVGATVVQSLFNGLAIGATLKAVRGTSAFAVVADTNRGALLGDTDLPGRSATKFDADLGVLATAGPLRAGLTVRNLREPEFRTGSGAALTLERQVRAGLAVLAATGWTVAADFDLTKTRSPFGKLRDMALGTEVRLARRALVRGGVRFNTLGGALPGRSASVSAGASYAIRAAILVDAQVTAGSERSTRGWGLAARFVY